jgi:hypothetical protein
MNPTALSRGRLLVVGDVMLARYNRYIWVTPWG